MAFGVRHLMGLVGLLAWLAAGGCGSHGGGGSAPAPAAATTGGSAATATTPTERLVQKLEAAMTAADLGDLLDRTVGASAASGAARTVAYPLRPGVYLTATPRGQNILLRVEVDAAGARTREAMTEVAISAQLGKTFVDLAQSAMATMAFTAATPGLAQPWNLLLRAESPSGGAVEVGVVADISGNFTLSWTFESPMRAIDGYSAPAAFGGAPATEKIGGTVHFPIAKDQFQVFVNRAYGYNAPQRFVDFALIPHTWLHLTVTGDAANKQVTVHFDAVTTTGARLSVGEAPASTSVGGRFFDETVARMTEMLDAEARAAGSSRPWNSNFFYAAPDKGVVEVVTRGEKGAFDIAYRVETPTHVVNP